MLLGYEFKEIDEAKEKAKEEEERLKKEREERYAVPLALSNDFTPLEVEEAITLFEEVDADGSGAIDSEELRTIMLKMGEEARPMIIYIYVYRPNAMLMRAPLHDAQLWPPFCSLFARFARPLFFFCVLHRSRTTSSRP